MTTPSDSVPWMGRSARSARLPRHRLVEAARLVREGRTYSLAATGTRACRSSPVTPPSRSSTSGPLGASASPTRNPGGR